MVMHYWIFQLANALLADSLDLAAQDKMAAKADERIYHCEVQKLFKRGDEKRDWFRRLWRTLSVTELPISAARTAMGR
jgi:hypothetical protein